MISVKPEVALPPILQQSWLAGSITQVTNCRSVYRIRTRESGPLIVKPLQVGSRQAFLTAKLLSGNRDCPVLPSLYKTEHFPYYLWYRGYRYLITRALPGREADYLKLRDLELTLVAMGEWHRYSRRVLREEPARWNALRFCAVEEWEQRFKELEKCRNRAIQSQNAWSKQYLKLWYYFSDQAYEAIKEVKTVHPAGKEVICYHDWAHHNVIIDHEAAYLIDFDYMLVDHPVHDRVNLISRYLRLYQWSAEALLRVIWKFDRLYPFFKGELKLLRAYLLFPYEYWMIGRQYYLEQQPWSQKYYQDQWERKVAPFLKREKIIDLIGQL